MIDIDPAVAKRVVDQRWPSCAGELARNSVRDEEFVTSQLRLRDVGITHDERIVEIYDQLTSTEL